MQASTPFEIAGNAVRCVWPAAATRGRLGERRAKILERLRAFRGVEAGYVLCE